MNLLISVFLGVGIFMAGTRLFHKRPLLPFLDSLRQGKHTYLVVGIVAGILMPETESQYRSLDALRYGFLNVGLMWIGLLLGLECSLRQLRQAQWHLIGGQIASAVLIVGFSILSVLASGTILFQHLGLLSHLPLATLLCTCFILSTRHPEPTFLWRGTLTPPTPDPTPTIPIHNILAVLMLCLCSPLFAPDSTVTLGSFTFVSGISLLIFIIGSGITCGICLDFALRAHRKQTTGMTLAFGILLFFSGFGQTLQLPTLVLGFIAGGWLTNTTVAKRGLLEALSQVDNAIIPLFYIFVGTLIGGFGGGVFFYAPPLLPLIAMILIVRVIGRTLGYSISQYLWGAPESWRATLELSARPLGTLSVALAIQALMLLSLAHNTLIAGLLASVVVSQVTLFPPLSDPPRTPVSALHKD